MLDSTKIICHCNNVNKGDLIELIKRLKITTLEELLEQDELEVGNKCKACKASNEKSSLQSVLEEANIKMLKIDF